MFASSSAFVKPVPLMVTVVVAASGSRPVEGETLTSGLPTCEYLGDNCRSYTVKLTEGTYFQAQLNNPTESVSMELRDGLGASLVERSVGSQGSGFMEHEVTRTANYTLRVASDYQLYYDLFAFETPTTLAKVTLPASGVSSAGPPTIFMSRAAISRPAAAMTTQPSRVR